MKKLVVLMAIVSAVIFASCEVTPAASISGNIIDQLSGGPLVEGGYVNLYKKHGKDDYRWFDGKDIASGEQFFFFDNLKPGTYYVMANADNYISTGTESIKIAKNNVSYDDIVIPLEPHKQFLYGLDLSKWSVPKAGGTVTLTGKFRNNTDTQTNLTIFLGSEFWSCDEVVDVCLYGNPDLGTIQMKAAANDDTIFTIKITIPADAPNDTCIYPSAYAGFSKWEPKAGVKNVGCITKTYK
jgi:hypothetical protein